MIFLKFQERNKKDILYEIYIQVYNPKSLHLNFKEIDWKIFETVIKKLSFSNANFSLSDTFDKVNFELKSNITIKIKI